MEHFKEISKNTWILRVNIERQREGRFRCQHWKWSLLQSYFETLKWEELHLYLTTSGGSMAYGKYKGQGIEKGVKLYHKEMVREC